MRREEIWARREEAVRERVAPAEEGEEEVARTGLRPVRRLVWGAGGGKTDRSR